jgi:serine/threonine-protein kinase
MSPEQLSGKKIDGRSDLFSLAVSLYQMLCGKLPFAGESMGRLMFAISSEPPIDILSINPDVPHGVVAFIDRALDKEPDNRYQTGEEFAAALRASVTAGAAVHGASESATSVVDIQL